MSITFEKRATNRLIDSASIVDIDNIREILGCQNKIEADCIGINTVPDKTLNIFIESIIGPGNEVLTVGPTNQNIYRMITSNDASYFEFYEKPTFLPDPFSLIGKISNRTKVIILGNPNRFTGVVYSQKEIENILNVSKDTLLILDESTYESSKVTSIELINKYDNLALIRSFEKNKNNRFDYIISNRIIIRNFDNGIFDNNFNSSELAIILSNLKDQGSRIVALRASRQEMLYLSIRLRMFGVGCFLNPDYSLVIKIAEPDELLFKLNESGVKAIDLACFPGLAGNILLSFNSDINAVSVVDIFEKYKNKIINNDRKTGRNRLTIYRPPESDNELNIASNRNIESQHSLESNMVF